MGSSELTFIFPSGDAGTAFPSVFFPLLSVPSGQTTNLINNLFPFVDLFTIPPVIKNMAPDCELIASDTVRTNRECCSLSQ